MTASSSSLTLLVFFCLLLCCPDQGQGCATRLLSGTARVASRVARVSNVARKAIPDLTGLSRTASGGLPSAPRPRPAGDNTWTYVFPDFYSKKPPDVPPVTSPRTVQPPPPQPSDIDASTGGLHRRKEDDLAENKNGGDVAAAEALDAADDAEDAGDAADDVAEGNLQGRGKEAGVEGEPIDANSGDALKGDELSKAADDILEEQVPFLGAHESTPKKGIDANFDMGELMAVVVLVVLLLSLLVIVLGVCYRQIQQQKEKDGVGGDVERQNGGAEKSETVANSNSAAAGGPPTVAASDQQAKETSVI